jgi:hypothetical protein
VSYCCLTRNEQFVQLISEMLNKHFPTGTYAKTLGVVVINIDKCVLQSLRFNQKQVFDIVLIFEHWWPYWIFYLVSNDYSIWRTGPDRTENVL